MDPFQCWESPQHPLLRHTSAHFEHSPSEFLLPLKSFADLERLLPQQLAFLRCTFLVQGPDRLLIRNLSDPADKHHLLVVPTPPIYG